MYNTIKLRQEEIPSYIELGLAEAPCVLYGIHNKPFVWICKEECCDFDYIEANKIHYKKLDGMGSSIVCSEGDIDFGFFGSKDFCEEMLNKLSVLVAKKLTGYKFINNDFMYNGNKYGSVTYIDFGETHYIGVHISNNIDKTLIEKICKKKCYKQPEKLPVPITEADVLELYAR